MFSRVYDLGCVYVNNTFQFKKNKNEINPLLGLKKVIHFVNDEYLSKDFDPRFVKLYFKASKWVFWTMYSWRGIRCEDQTRSYS